MANILRNFISNLLSLVSLRWRSSTAATDRGQVNERSVLLTHQRLIAG